MCVLFLSYFFSTCVFNAVTCFISDCLVSYFWIYGLYVCLYIRIYACMLNTLGCCHFCLFLYSHLLFWLKSSLVQVLQSFRVLPSVSVQYREISFVDVLRVLFFWLLISFIELFSAGAINCANTNLLHFQFVHR